MKITLQTVLDALGHCSDKNQDDLLRYLNSGTESWAGIVLGKMIDEYQEADEDVGESEEDEWNRDADKAGIR